MKNFIYSIGFLFFIILFIPQTCFSQDTCFVTVKYGENPDAGKFAVVNGIRMYYETYGDPANQPLLLIHGNGGSIYAERCQIEHFKDRYYVIIADSRFHGKTENGSELLTYDLMAEDYNSLLDFLKIDSVYIIGQSDGGIIGLLMAMNYPKKVKKLVTTAPNLRADKTALPQWYIQLDRNDLKEIEKRIARGETSADIIRLKSQINLMVKYPKISNKELAKIKAPVLVMAGDGDIIKLEHILDIYQNIPKAQLFIMPGATHFMLRDEYKIFNQIAERFLDNPFIRPTTKEQLIK
ncbi:MAG TPA: alpha/beta hydrolase [Bacteroidales bacterium]|nr:alpha/beta hydrolase [Bacteroidales bacterium]